MILTHVDCGGASCEYTARVATVSADDLVASNECNTRSATCWHTVSCNLVVAFVWTHHFVQFDKGLFQSVLILAIFVVSLACKNIDELFFNKFGNLSATMTIKHSKNCLPIRKLHWSNMCVFLFLSPSLHTANRITHCWTYDKLNKMFWLYCIVSDIVICEHCNKTLKEGQKLRSRTCIECDSYLSKACSDCCDWFEYAHDHLSH